MKVVQRLVLVLLSGILFAPHFAPAQSPMALAGKVSSAEEGAMEGVLVSAKKAGSTITITVVSDAEGRYGFPARKLMPGKYALKVRAAGYELDSPTAIEVGKAGAGADLKLRKTADLAAQLSNGEWMTSMRRLDALDHLHHLVAGGVDDVDAVAGAVGDVDARLLRRRRLGY